MGRAWRNFFLWASPAGDPSANTRGFKILKFPVIDCWFLNDNRIRAEPSEKAVMSSSDGIDVVNAAVVAGSAIGSIAVVGAIVLVIICIACCKEQLLNGCVDETTTTERHRHRRRRRRRYRDVVSQREEEAQGTATTENAEIQLENSEIVQPDRPPPSYNRASQYSSVESDIHVYTDEQAGTHVSMYVGDEDRQDSSTLSDQEQDEVVQNEVPQPTSQTTLPPTYSTAQMEAMAAGRAVMEPRGGTHRESEGYSSPILEEESAEPQNVSAEGESQLPPSYSTAKLELMKRKADVEQTSPSGHS